MSRSRAPKCHNGRDCGVCLSDEKVYNLDPIDQLTADAQAWGMYDIEMQMADDCRAKCEAAGLDWMTNCLCEDGPE